ncbi:ASCH domain-containing protein [Lactiplantibacillus daoliensis]|uniref:ASCH domain-containing protein n=1 Tax=Lactiplantibacillus daoliensis TaxID=2559916 RepID=A0ABW1UI58_9LACO|nr:ASCH domain-containing protein [Lactiplantibacillus daoliensis]
MTPENFFEQAKATLKLPADTHLQSAYQFGVAANSLAQLVLTGTKTATTSAYDVILDTSNNPICVTKTDSVVITPYREIGADHAYHEGEGDRSYAYWRKAHDAFFTQEYATVGKQFEPDQAKMVLERFHVVYPL